MTMPKSVKAEILDALFHDGEYQTHFCDATPAERRELKDLLDSRKVHMIVTNEKTGLVKFRSVRESL